MAAVTGSAAARHAPPAPEIDICYLASWPLVQAAGGGAEAARPIERLDFETERENLRETIRTTRRRVRLRMDYATSNTLRTVVTLGCRAIHYTGHGMRGQLAFEDGRGRLHAVSSAQLRDLFAASGAAHGVRFVFVSACFSEAAGEAFVGAGVPHVIAVRQDAKVADRSSQIFMKHLYLALLRRHTVAEAFSIAQSAVSAAPHVSHANEDQKFLLLPRDGDHSARIFDDVPDGVLVDCSPRPARVSLRSLTEPFIGRNANVQDVVESLRPRGGQRGRRRVVTITGEEGIGKTEVAKAAARYMGNRRHFDNVVFLSLFQVGDAGGVAGGGEGDLQPLQPLTAAQRSVSAASLASARHGGPRFGSVAALAAHELSLAVRDPGSVGELCALLPQNESVLMVLDGAGHLLNADDASPLSVRSFINQVLRRHERVQFIVTSGLRVFGPEWDDVNEYVLELPPLSPRDAAQLFYHVAPRRIEPEEFGSVDKSRALLDLQQHPAVCRLRGHPRRICQAAQLLTDCKMSDIPGLIREQLPPSPSPPGERGRHLLSPAPPARAAISGAPPSPLLGANGGVGIPGDGAMGDAWREMCGEADAAPWPAFKQALSARFVRATLCMTRPLSDRDMSAVRARLERAGSPPGTVTRASFAALWDFYAAFEECIAKVRLLWMMTEPVVLHGLVSRVEAAHKLRGMAPGTFMLRFSENNAGHIAVAYVSADRGVEHTLIKVEPDGFSIFMVDGELTYDSLEALVMGCRPLASVLPGLPKAQIFDAEANEPC